MCAVENWTITFGTSVNCLINESYSSIESEWIPFTATLRGNKRMRAKSKLDSVNKKGPYCGFSRFTSHSINKILNDLEAGTSTCCDRFILLLFDHRC